MVNVKTLQIHDLRILHMNALCYFTVMLKLKRDTDI